MGVESRERLERIPAGTDHFTVLGLERRLNLDLDALEETYHALSRQYHPDYHATGPAASRAIAESNTAAVTAAYRTLRDPIGRVAYLIGLERGVSDPSTQTEQVPQMLLMEAFEARETLEEYEIAGDTEIVGLAGALREALKEWQERAEDVDARLSVKFDAWDALAGSGDDHERKALIHEMEVLLGERRYVVNLAHDLETALAGNDLLSKREKA
jgi:molecular chaperone HscB